MSSKTIRWAILGAGKIAHKFAQDFASTHGGALVAVASRDTQRAGEFAQQYHIPNVFSYDELYQSTEVDVVYVATTHNFHFGQCLKCIENGKAVLCEKPITINDGEFKKLVAAAKQRKVFLMEAMWTYFLPAIREAKRWLDGGRIGNLKLIEIDFGFPMPYDPQGRLFNPQLAGGGLLDLGVYNLALALYFAGTKAGRVQASGIMTNTGVDETICMQLTFGNMLASLNTCITARLHNKILLTGESGSIEIPFFWKAASATLFNNEQQALETFTDDRKEWGYHHEIQHVTNALQAGATESPVMPHATTLLLQELMTDIRRQIGFLYPAEEQAP